MTLFQRRESQDDEFIGSTDAATRALDQVFPGLAAARTQPREARFHWPSHPWSLGSYLCLRPNDWSRLRGPLGDAAPPLFFAGEHCALGAQGFMEGGVESGELAAESVRIARNVAVRSGVSPIQARRARGVA